MKLTKETKGEIIRVTVKTVFADRNAEIKAREDKLAKEAFCVLYPLEIQKQMDKLPDGFFAQSTVVYIVFPEADKSRRGARIPIRMTSSKKISADDRYGYEKPVLKFAENVPLSDDIRKLIADKEKLEEDINTFFSLLLEVIDSLVDLEDMPPLRNTFKPRLDSSTTFSCTSQCSVPPSWFSWFFLPLIDHSDFLHCTSRS